MIAAILGHILFYYSYIMSLIDNKKSPNIGPLGPSARM